MKAKQNEKVMSNVKKKRLPAQSSKHREQGERVIWYRRIQFKLVASFMVPVLFIVILGLASYSKASQAIVRSYESSAGQTLNMMNQYLSVIVDSVQSKYKSYISDGDLSKYFTGMTVDSADIINTYKSYTTDFKGFLATDSTISNLYILSDTAASITTTSPEETALYSAYLATDAGVKCSNDIYSYYLFGNISSADETFGTSGNDYGLRLVRHTKGYKGFLVIDIKKSSVVKALSSLDPGTGGYVGIVTSDGTELLSDGTNPASPVFSNLECFEKVKENDESQGSEYIMYNGANYLFLYSKLEGRDAVLFALIPRSILTTQASDIKKPYSSSCYYCSSCCYHDWYNICQKYGSGTYYHSQESASDCRRGSDCVD